MSLGQVPNQVQQNIDISIAAIADFCDRWQIFEFALFGSVLLAAPAGDGKSY